MERNSALNLFFSHVIFFNASLDGNPYLCTNSSCGTKTEKKTSVAVPVVASLASVLVVLGALFAVYWHFIRGRRHGS